MDSVVLPLFTSGFMDNQTNLIVAIAIGIMFGFILERAGFATAAHIAPIFYFKNNMVAQVMVSAIVTAATLIFIASSFGYIDYNNIFIPSTYTYAYIVGGLIFGVGMVMSGWCPGTAATGVATLKIDAIVFLVGLMVGMYFYFEIYNTYEALRELANGHNLGRFTIGNLLGTNDIRVSYIVTLVASFGLLMFMGIMKKVVNKKGDN
jgi:uncharacterized membrane protein YedE/YeeE